MQRVIFGGLVAMLLNGCGWGYARRMEAKKTAPKVATQPIPQAAPARQVPQPVPVKPEYLLPKTPPPDESYRVIEGTNDLFTLGENHRYSTNAQGPKAMSKHAFRIRLIDGLNHTTKQIHCSTGKVIHFDQKVPSPALLEVARASNIPLGVWTLTVDPSGTRPDLTTNAWYRHISKFHVLEFLKQNQTDGTVLYRYVGPRQARAPR